MAKKTKALPPAERARVERENSEIEKELALLNEAIKKAAKVLDDRDAMLGHYSPQCSLCRHVTGFLSCEAFGEKGIPEEIWLGKVRHDKPYPGDHGIQFDSRGY